MKMDFWDSLIQLPIFTATAGHTERLMPTIIQFNLSNRLSGKLERSRGRGRKRRGEKGNVGGHGRQWKDWERDWRPRESLLAFVKAFSIPNRTGDAVARTTAFSQRWV